MSSPASFAQTLLCVGLACLILPARASALKPSAEPERREGMTQARMEDLVRERVQRVRGVSGQLEFTYLGRSMAVISDRAHDRMRIIAPITDASALTAEQVARVLEANFHTALDARYGTSGGTLFAAYIHPLSTVTEAQLESALRQVATLAATFGSTYSSGELSYGGR